MKSIYQNEELDSQVRILGRILSKEEESKISGGGNDYSPDLPKPGSGTDDHIGTCTREADCD